ncbi:3'-5' exonuclease [Undibacterium fentianense]|uniref:DNA-directed DNA polymerase n=1 Tax=Undibacterium fentianense TaxID=2828728 RepID=A0A941DW62_9BURK|nr:3'-5' exonuclease [Undibacterium fentianense]MBR7798429.1 3'-5' exonuclease [Undibacterium fentianense]
MLAEPIVMIDFETTGMSPVHGDRVTEVAAIRIVGNEIVERYVSLINCDVEVSPFITQLTGITQAMVDRAPPIAKVMPELLRFIGRDCLAAHNASFDEKFLYAESARLGLHLAHRGTVCTVKLARRILPGLSSYALGALATRLGIGFKGRAHRAEADAEVAANLLMHLSQHLSRHYQFGQVDPMLLVKLNQLSAAKVAAYLQQHYLQQQCQVRSPGSHFSLPKG